MKTKNLIYALLLAATVMSCTRKESNDSSTISEDEIEANSDIDAAQDDIANVLEEQLLLTNTDNLNRGPASIYAGCATITRVPALGVIPTIGQLIQKTINFGTQGCLQPSGNKLSGILNISYVYNPSAPTQTVTYIFENFYHNSKKLNGQKTFTRTMTAATATSPSHPIVTMTVEMLITLSDGRKLTRKGTRTREIIAGFGTDTLLDNEYSITGEWTTTYPNTTTKTSTITSPLIVKLACLAPKAIITQGVISFVRNSNTATLNYGNGSCDNEAVFTLNGVSRTVLIRR